MFSGLLQECKVVAVKMYLVASVNEPTFIHGHLGGCKAAVRDKGDLQDGHRWWFR